MEKIEHIIFDKGMPKKNKFILGLMLLRFPLFIPGVKLLIKKYLKHCKNVDFLPGFVAYHGNIYAEDVEFGDCFLMDYAPIHIGKGTKFGWQCMIATAYHEHEKPEIIHAKSVIIGKSVQIYSRVTILGGTTIGDNSVIGAASVVTKDIPANCFAAGNPAKVIKYFK